MSNDGDENNKNTFERKWATGKARKKSFFIFFFYFFFASFYKKRRRIQTEQVGGGMGGIRSAENKVFLFFFFFLSPRRGFSGNNNTKRSGEEAAEKTHWVNITSQINLSRGKIFSFPHHYTRKKAKSISLITWLPLCCVVCLCSVMLAPAPPFRLFWAPTKTTLTIIRDVILIWHRRQRRRVDILELFFFREPLLSDGESREFGVLLTFDGIRSPFAYRINRMKLEDKFGGVGWCRLLTIRNVLLIFYQLAMLLISTTQGKWLGNGKSSLSSIIYISRARFALVQQINYHFLGCWVSSTLKLRVAMSSDAAATVYFLASTVNWQ